ncbi:MAG: VWA domain-containing protein [Crocinitomicaceae bacterium]|nr:VWA domain-containing protein [Crocinitomicaceae bacterium]MDG1776565.1 VWA domain-containing protein [Crocinitomicaceae bacterium]
MLKHWNIRFWEYEFFSPHWLWLMLLIPFALFIVFYFEKNRPGDINFSGSTFHQESIGSSWISRLRIGIILLYGIIGVLIIFAMAKPFQWSQYDNFDERYKNGIDIILAMDVSLSMLTRDFEPNRLEASKEVAQEFINGRAGDRIGLVVYAGEAYTACPATLDYTVLKQHISKISGERIEGGTAIGTGLGTAVARLRNDSIASKVIILLTDGSNNSGELSPEMAAELARSKNIRVYTIGVGKVGNAPSPVMTPFGMRYQTMPVEIDEATLKKIAHITNGNYFRATDMESLKSIYAEIDALEKRKINDESFKNTPPSNPQAFLNWAILFAFITWGSNYLIFRIGE